MAAVLLEAIRYTGAGSAHVVGLSVGGMIAQALASSAPTAVASLVLIGTAVRSPMARAGLRARADTTRRGGIDAVLPATLGRWFTPRTFVRRPDLVDRVTKTLLADDPLIHVAV